MRLKLPSTSIAAKVLLALAVSIVLVMSLSGALYYTAEKNRTILQLREKAAQTSERLSNSLIYPLWNVSTAEIAKTIDLEMTDEDLIAIVLHDEFNHFLIGRIENKRGRITNYRPLNNSGTQIKNVTITTTKKIFKDSEYLGEVRLYFTDRNMNHYLNYLAWKIILLMALVSLFSILIIYYTLHRIVLTPIMTLQKITNRLRAAVGGGTPGDRQTASSDADEIELLGHNFDSMAAELAISQEQLQHTAEHLQTLLDETPDAVLTLDSAGRIRSVNQTFLRMFHKSSEDFIKGLFVDLAANTDLQKRIPGYLEQALKGQSVEFEWLVMRKTAETFPVLVRIRSMYSGDEALLLAVMTDITEHQQAEAALMARTEELEGFFSSSVDLLCIADMGGYFRRLNREWQTVIGFDPAELEGRQFLDFIHPDDVEPTLKAMEELLTQHEIWSFTNRYRCKDGSYRWLEWRAVPAGSTIYAAARDITERIRTEDALRSSESRLRTIGDNLPGGMIYQLIIAPDGSRRFTYISAGIEKMHEVTAEAVIEDASILYHQIIDEDRPALIREEEQSIRMMAPFNIEARSRVPSGAIRWMKITSMPRMTSTGEVLFDGVEVDITDQKHTENQLQESLGLLRATLESTASGILMTDLHAKIRNYNHHFAEMWHIPEQLLESGEDAPVLNFVLDQVSDPDAFYQGVHDLYNDPQKEQHDIISFKDGRIFERYSIPTFRGSKIVGRVWSFNDITQQKQSEKALQESEERFSKAFQSNPAPMTISEIATGLFIDANERWLALTGYTRDELIGHTSLELDMHIDPGLREAMVKQLLQKGYFKEIDMSIRTRDGKCVNALWSAEIITLGGRDVMLTLLIDVTERKQAEKKLLESMGLLQATLESAADGILVTDLKAHIVNYNQRFMELLQMPDDVLASGDDRGVLKRVLKQLKEPDSFLEGVRRLYAHPDIEHHDVLRFLDGRFFERYSIPTYRGDEIVGRVWSFRDVTETKQAEEALRSSEAKYRRLHESMTDAFVRVDMNGRLVESNKAYQEMIGYTREELSQLSYEDLTPSRWHDLEAQIIKNQVLPRGYSDIYEKEYIHKDGTIFSVELRTYAMRSEDGQPIGMWAIVRDITARQQAIEALRESEALFRSQFEYGNIGIAITSPNKGWLRVNKRISDILGYTEEELLQKSWAEMTHPEDLDADLLQFNSMLKGNIDAYEMDKRFIRKDREIVTTHLSVSCFRNADRSIRFVIASLVDITASTRFLEKLRASETITRALLNATSDALFVTDTKGILLALNTTLAGRFGKTVEAMVGTDIYDYMPPDLKETRLKHINQVIRSGETVNFVDQRQEMWLENTFYPIFDAMGVVSMIAVYSRDITLRKQAEEKLEEVLDFNRKIVSSSAVGIVVFSETGQCVSTNEAAANILGIPVSGLLSQNFNNIESWHKSGLINLARKVLQEKESVSAEINMTTSTGKSICINCYLNWFVNAGKPHILVLIIDDTERKQAEIKLQQYHVELEQQVELRTQELSEANDALIRFRRFAETSGQGFGMATLDGQITYANVTLRRLIGDGEIERGKSVSFLDRYPEEYRDKLQAEIIPSVLQDQQWIGELALVTSNGHIIPTIENYFLIRDEAGNPSLIADVVTDVQDMKRTENELRKYRDHLEELVRQRTRELQELNEDLQNEILVRLNTEQALRESEQRYRTLFESAPIGITVMKPDLQFEYVNPRFTEMLGYTLSDIPNKDTWFKKAYPDTDYRSYVINLWKGDLSVSKQADRTLKVRTKDGKEKVIHFRTAILDNGDHLMSYEDVTELQQLNEALRAEISERVEAEEALRESESRYRTLFEGAPVGIGVTTMDGAVVAANEGLLQMLKATTREEAFQTDVNNIFLNPDERGDLMKRISRDGYVREYETRLRALDGSVKDVLMTLSRFSYTGKDAILSVIQDISWKKQSEEETRHLKNYLANIIDSMPSILVGVDKDGMVTQWNTAAEQHTGISGDTATGQPIDKVLPILSNNIRLISDAIQTNQTQLYPRLQNPVGDESRFLDVTVYPLVSNGSEGAVVRIDDITDRIRIEEMMIQTEKMLSVGGLAAGMAHEINNPLGIILAASQNVQRRFSPDLPVNIKVAEECGIPLSTVQAYLKKRQVLTFLEDISNGVNRASQIVTNMLSFSRRPDELSALENVTDLMEQTLLLAATDYDLKKKHDFRQIQIDKEYDPTTPLILCQASKIQQVFLNILRNAAEAMEENPNEDNPPRLNLRIMPSGKWVRIEITDNGPGMEETVRKHIFEPFFTTKPPGVGTGLGLSVSYFIIKENHGGTISVESSPGAGSQFIIQLPAAKENQT